MKKAVIFDLDGTLLYSLEDLADSLNKALTHFKYPTHPLESYNTLVGNGVKKLIEDALPLGNYDTNGEILKMYLDIYNKNWDNKTRPYKGIIEMLQCLKDNGIKLAVFSNKPQLSTEKCVNHFFNKDIFDIVRGAQDGFPLKPSGAGLLEIINELGLNKNEILYIGDSSVDMLTASDVNVDPLAVLWGYRTEEELKDHGATNFASTPKDICTYLSL